MGQNKEKQCFVYPQISFSMQHKSSCTSSITSHREGDTSGLFIREKNKRHHSESDEYCLRNDEMVCLYKDDCFLFLHGFPFQLTLQMNEACFIRK